MLSTSIKNLGPVASGPAPARATVAVQLSTNHHPFSEGAYVDAAAVELHIGPCCRQPCLFLDIGRKRNETSGYRV
jgi:hypothetical protein